MKFGTIVAATTLISLASSVLALAQSPQPNPAMQKLREACAADVQKLCPGVEPGGGRIAQCIQSKVDQLSDGCKKAILDVQEQAPPRQDPSH